MCPQGRYDRRSESYLPPRASRLGLFPNPLSFFMLELPGCTTKLRPLLPCGDPRWRGDAREEDEVMSMNTQERIAPHRLSVLEVAEALHSVSAAYRQHGMTRTQVYD